MARLTPDWRRLGRLVLSVVEWSAAALAVLLLPRWLDAVLTPMATSRTLVAMIVAAEYAYAATAAAALMGVAAFGLVGRRLRSRGLLLCLSLLTSFLLAEGIAAAWLALDRRSVAPTAPDPPLPDRFDDPTPAGETTLTVLGESSAEGMPYNDWLSVGRIVAWQLGRAFPTRTFRADVLAHGGDTLADQYLKLARVRRRPDVLIVYCGHNEFSAGIPWSRRVSHYIDDRRWSFEEEAARLSPLCRLIHQTADRHRVAMPPSAVATPPMVDAPCYTPTDFASRLAAFRRRLEAIVAFGERIGAPTVLVVPPANDADFDPNRSFLPAGTVRAERSEFTRDFQAARRSEADDPARAIGRYRTLLDRHPAFAETHFRLGLLLARRGEWEEAYTHFTAARDLDGFPMRCPSAFQQVYRDVADAHRRGSILVDGQALFHAIGQNGLLGDDLFHDAMHPALRGHVALAQAIVEAIRDRRALGWPEGVAAPAIDPADCVTHFGFPPGYEKALAERGAMFYFAVAPLRYDPSRRIARRNAFLAAPRRAAAGTTPSRPSR